jgi:hypothetical protein
MPVRRECPVREPAGSNDPRNTLDFRELRGSWFLQG